MKKFLLSLSLLMGVLLGNAQVILNELYVDPSQGNPKFHNEFFELYNTSILPTPINLNCYTLVSYFINKSGSNVTRGFYVLDIPSVEIKPKSYQVGAAATPFGVQQPQGQPEKFTPNFDWTASDFISSGGNLTKYTLNSQGTGYSITTYANLTAAEKQNIFPVNGTGSSNHAIFLFNANIEVLVNGRAKYLDGFIGGLATNIAPEEIIGATKGMPDLTGLVNACGTYSISFKTDVRKVESVNSAAGTDNGYMRLGDGLCGTWVKSSSSVTHTPGTKNGTGQTNTNSVITPTTAATLVCDNNISFQITGPADLSLYSIEVQLYWDKNSDSKLDGGDEYVKSILVSGPSPTNIYTFDALEAGKKYLVVYKTASGCYDKVEIPQPIAPLVTNQYMFCNTQAAFSISSPSATTTTYGFPVTVEFLENDIAIGSPITVTQPDVIYYSGMVTDPSKVSIRYTPANCLSAKTVSNSTTPFTTVTGSLTTTETVMTYAPPKTSLVDISVDVTALNSSSIQPQSSNIFPLEVRLYIDNNPNNSTPDTAYAVDNTSYLGSVYIQSIEEGAKFFTATDLNRQFTTGDYDKDIYIVYQPKLACYGNVVERILSAPAALPVSYASFTATRSSNNQVVLEWETAMEENNRGFHVQRNTDGNWKNIGFVFTQADNGNSSAQLKYAFKDANNSKGITQYRILQVDIDGKGKYSEVRAVRGLETAARVTLFPNPSHTGSFSLLFEDGTSVRDVMVSDVSGRVVKQYKSVNGNTLTVNGLIDGFYTVQVANRSNGSISVEKVIIKKR